MIVQNRLRSLFESGEAPPAGVEVSEGEIVTATQYVSATAEDLEISLQPDTVLWEQYIEFDA